MNLLAIFLLAILVEAVTEYFFEPLPSRFKPYAAALFAVFVCVAYGADLPAAFGLIAMWPVLGSIVTGLVIGRGSNYLAILLRRLQVVTAPAQDVGNVAEDRHV